MHYRRVKTEGGSYFFTVNLQNRNQALLVDHIVELRSAFRYVKKKHPFDILAAVVLPDHLHMIWRLPTGDSNYPMRWNLIKARFSKTIAKGEFCNGSRQKKRERGIWQRRYWEHCIRDDRDLANHIDYIHDNPVKHGYVKHAIDWPYSSIHKYAGRGKNY